MEISKELVKTIVESKEISSERKDSKSYLNKIIKLQRYLRQLVKAKIFDYSLLKELTHVLLKNKENKALIKIFVADIADMHLEIIKAYIKEPSYSEFLRFVTLALYYMSLLKNFQTYTKNEKYTLFHLESFGDESKLMPVIIEVINMTMKEEFSNKITKVYCNIFSKEYKEFFVRNSLEEVYIKTQSRFCETTIDVLDIHAPDIYKKMLTSISLLDFDYDVLKTSMTKNEDFIISKPWFIQSIVRIVFSKEKYKYLEKNEAFKFELNFFKLTIDKCLALYLDKFGTSYKTLFRNDNFLDDIIKYSTLIFSNCLFFEDYVDYLVEYSEKYKESEKIAKNEQEKESLFVENFQFFFVKFLENMRNNMSNIVILLMKMIHQSVQEKYNLEPNNYHAIYTFAVFNFLTSPKLHEIYQINHTFVDIKNLNRLLRNICFNVQFQEDDSMSFYNVLIEHWHIMLNYMIEEILSNFKEESYEEVIRHVIEDYLDYPEFLFYYDCRAIACILKNKK